MYEVYLAAFCICYKTRLFWFSFVFDGQFNLQMESVFCLHIVCSKGWYFTKVFWHWNLQVYCWHENTLPTYWKKGRNLPFWNGTQQMKQVNSFHICSFFYIAVAFKMLELYRIGHTAPTGNKLPCLLLPFLLTI